MVVTWGIVALLHSVVFECQSHSELLTLCYSSSILIKQVIVCLFVCLLVCLSICSLMDGQTARPNGLKFGG